MWLLRLQDWSKMLGFYYESPVFHLLEKFYTTSYTCKRAKEGQGEKCLSFQRMAGPNTHTQFT